MESKKATIYNSLYEIWTHIMTITVHKYLILAVSINNWYIMVNN